MRPGSVRGENPSALLVVKLVTEMKIACKVLTRNVLSPMTLWKSSLTSASNQHIAMPPTTMEANITPHTWVQAAALSGLRPSHIESGRQTHRTGERNNPSEQATAASVHTS